MESRVSFRPLARSDYAHLQRWLAAPHVAMWWNERFDLLSVEAKYGAAIDGRDPIHVYVIQLDGVPIGWIQWYRWRDFPEHAVHLGADVHCAGVDLAIGEVERTGAGLGPTILSEFSKNYIFVNSEINAIVADPATANRGSVRAFEKAGFRIARTVQLPAEGFDRAVVRWDWP